MDTNKNVEELRTELDELRARYDFLLAAMDYMPNPIFLKDEEGRFLFFNKAYSDFFKVDREKYLGKTALDLDYLPMEDRRRFHRDALKLIESMGVVAYDDNFSTPEGIDRPSFYWSCGFRDEGTGRHGLVGEVVDISKERELQKRLKVMAETDHASGLYNRTVMWSKGNESIERMKKTSQNTCMIMIDLDHFKSINDEFGHIKGDEVLARFADILKRECRHDDLPIRYGGDEFLIILQNIELENAVRVADRIRSRAEKDLILPDGRSITTSIGIIKVDERESFEDNLSRLDEYLYRAKSEGRNRIVCE